MKKERYLQILDEIGQDDHNPNSYCIYREILKNMYMEPRTLVQFKCIEKLKYELSCKKGFDVGYEEAARLWVDEGYAKKFAEIYSESERIENLYKKIKGFLINSRTGPISLPLS